MGFSLHFQTHPYTWDPVDQRLRYIGDAKRCQEAVRFGFLAFLFTHPEIARPPGGMRLVKSCQWQDHVNICKSTMAQSISILIFPLIFHYISKIQRWVKTNPSQRILEMHWSSKSRCLSHCSFHGLLQQRLGSLPNPLQISAVGSVASVGSCLPVLSLPFCLHLRFSAKPTAAYCILRNKPHQSWKLRGYQSWQNSENTKPPTNAEPRVSSCDLDRSCPSSRRADPHFCDRVAAWKPQRGWVQISAPKRIVCWASFVNLNKKSIRQSTWLILAHLGSLSFTLVQLHERHCRVALHPPTYYRSCAWHVPAAPRTNMSWILMQSSISNTWKPVKLWKNMLKCNNRWHKSSMSWSIPVVPHKAVAEVSE